jgi:hypothetical protein
MRESLQTCRQYGGICFAQDVELDLQMRGSLPWLKRRAAVVRRLTVAYTCTAPSHFYLEKCWRGLGTALGLSQRLTVLRLFLTVSSPHYHAARSRSSVPMYGILLTFCTGLSWTTPPWPRFPRLAITPCARST